MRELRNTVERMIVESKNTLIELQSFRKVDTVVVERSAPPAVDPSLPYQQAMDEYQRQYITAVVDECGGDLRRAAARMELHLSTLYRKMEKLGLPLHKEESPET